MVETLLSNARGVGLLPGGKTKIPEALWCTPPKKRDKMESIKTPLLNDE